MLESKKKTISDVLSAIIYGFDTVQRGASAPLLPLQAKSGIENKDSCVCLSDVKTS